MTIRTACIAFLIATVSLVAGAASNTPMKSSWAEFWHSVKVDPPPPEDFLDAPAFRGKILNLTTGRLSDDVVKKWIEADLRRGVGDSWAYGHLRRDVADAGIFGPPGLNGTSEGIDRERANGVTRIDSEGTAERVAAAVVWLSKEDQRAHPSSG